MCGTRTPLKTAGARGLVETIGSSRAGQITKPLKTEGMSQCLGYVMSQGNRS